MEFIFTLLLLCFVIIPGANLKAVLILSLCMTIWIIVRLIRAILMKGYFTKVGVFTIFTNILLVIYTYLVTFKGFDLIQFIK